MPLSYPNRFGLNINHIAREYVAPAAPDVPDPLDAIRANTVAYWRLSESSGARSDSFATYDLTDNNTVGTDTGKVEALAANFITANSENLSYTDGSGGIFDLLLNGTNPFTIAYWIKHADGVSGGESVFARQLSPGAAGTMVFLASGRTYLQIVKGGGDALYGSYAGGFTTDWQYHTWVYDGSRSISGLTAYLDASPQSITTSFDTLSGAVAPQAADFKLGASGAGYYLDATLEQFGIFDRELTSDEVSLLWNGGSGVQLY